MSALQQPNQPSQETPLQRIAYAATERVGSPVSIVIHSVLFVGIFGLYFFGWKLENILLFLTTLVSLEAIYLAIFIQMTVNRQARELQEVGKDVDEIREEVEDIAEDVEDISEDIEEDKAETKHPVIAQDQLNKIETTLQKLLEEIEKNKQR